MNAYDFLLNLYGSVQNVKSNALATWQSVTTDGHTPPHVADAAFDAYVKASGEADLVTNKVISAAQEAVNTIGALNITPA